MFVVPLGEQGQPTMTMDVDGRLFRLLGVVFPSLVAIKLTTVEYFVLSLVSEDVADVPRAVGE